MNEANLPPLNPYEAPRASLQGRLDPTIGPTRRSRWALLRFIPVVYFGLFAVVLPVGAVIGAGMILYLVATTTNPALLTSRRFIDMVLIVPAYCLMGPLAFVTARAWYRCQWRWALGLSTGFGVLVALGGLISKLR